jgi:hypothetical protein
MMLRVLPLFAAVIFFAFNPRHSLAADQVWSGDKQLQAFDCATDKIDRLVIRGTVRLIDSSDQDLSKDPHTIKIICDNLKFESGADLKSVSSMDIRIGGTTEGPVRISNERGKDGAKAPDTPDIWSIRKMQDGPDGGYGGNGRDAKKCIEFGHGSDPGGRGGDGQPGQSGLLYSAPPGASGKNGISAGEVVFVTRQFASGSTLDISAPGGRGGNGGRGGRGADGGIGGIGGTGGKGGNASDCHTASRGGDGGTGGRGGDGGNGGVGGDGGNGGNGGNVTTIKQAGGYDAPAVISNKGGIGGDPGLGGEKGLGAKGGKGGQFGFGGGGDCGFFGCDIKVDPKGPGGTGNAGGRGADGKDGVDGPLGNPGHDGDDGHIGHGFAGNATQEQIDKLIKHGM